MFRSQNFFNDFNNSSLQSQTPIKDVKIFPNKNYSLDQQNIIGPYRKDRVYSNLKREKITLVDSMVMVKEQSEEIEEEIHNEKDSNLVFEQSIIIRGKEEENQLVNFLF